MRSPEPPRIIIDSSPLRYLHTGLGQFSYHLLEELGRLPMDKGRVIALVHPRFANRVPPGIAWTPANWVRRHAPAALQPFVNPQGKVWHMTTENTRLTGIPRGAELVLTIHGLHFLDESPPAAAARELAKVQTLVDRASVISVVSQFTEALVRKKLRVSSQPVEVIPNGIAYTAGLARRPAWAPDRKFLFSVGTFFSRKNFHVLIPMMKHLPGYHLVLAGDANHPYGRQVRDAVRATGLEKQISIPGEITEGEKQWLYENGEALLFPSVSEGFGIPVIESFHLGRPVFCSKFGSLPEVGSSHAFYWDTFDPESMAQIVQDKLAADHPENRSARIGYASGFTWAKTAAGYQKIYRSLL